MNIVTTAKFARAGVLLALSLTLTACFHVQLTGSVGDAKLELSPLREPGNVLATATSLNPDGLLELWGQDVWDEQSLLNKLLFTGIATLSAKQLDPDKLYLVTARGGMDHDPQGTSKLSEEPEAVQGSWHAIASGAMIEKGNIKVSVLSEALYRLVEPRLGEWTDEEVLLRLNAAGQLVASDLDNSKTVDYTDVLRWNRTLDGAAYQGRLSKLDALSEAIRAGQPASMISDLSAEVLGSQKVTMTFDTGTVTVKTLNWAAPITSANFLSYVHNGFYDQMLVHRAIDGFMIQMGLVEYLGPNDAGQIGWGLKTPNDPIVNESDNGYSNLRGTLSMARTSNPDSASSQFFINQDNNTFLDHGSSNNPDGYAVFAKVTSGMEVVDEIAAERTVTVNGIGNDVPARGVVLESVTIK